MASITNRPAASGFNFSAFVAGLVTRIVVWNDARVTRKSLMALSARELDDLGLTRGDIDAIVDGTYTR